MESLRAEEERTPSTNLVKINYGLAKKTKKVVESCPTGLDGAFSIKRYVLFGNSKTFYKYYYNYALLYNIQPVYYDKVVRTGK